MWLKQKNYQTYLIFIRYCASATESGLPLIVMVRSVFPPSRSSQFEMRIIAPEIWRISAILVPPLPIMQPIKSFGTVISCCCLFDCCWLRVWLLVRNWEPAKAANAGTKTRQRKIVLDLFSNASVYLYDRYEALAASPISHSIEFKLFLTLTRWV